VTTGVAQGVMPPQVLGGPVWWYAVVVYVLALSLSAYVVIDSLRPARKTRFAELPEPGLLYTIFLGVYVALALGVWIKGIPRVVSAIPVGLTPFALAAGVAYLLRVVFPKPSAAQVEAAAAARAAKADATAAVSAPADPGDDDAFSGIDD
jgi:hypothetical protein